jgi:hypothetical protein
MLWDGVQKSSNVLKVKTVPDAKKQVEWMPFAWVYVEKRGENGELLVDAAGNPIYVHDPESWAKWDVNFEMAIKSGRFTVTKKVHLVPVEGATVTGSKKRRWKREIEGVWNQFKLHRAGCERGGDCSCGDWSSSCCMFSINVVCEFAPGHGEAVKLHRGKNAPNGYAEHLESGAPNPDWGKWWYSHDWWEERANVPASVRAHEFGHLLGMYDEYPAGAVKSVTLPDGIMRFHEDVPDSIMGGGWIVYPRHVKEFHEWFVSRTEKVVGELNLLSR